MNRKYREAFGYDMSSKEELILSFEKNKNIIKEENGVIQGFLNYVDNGDWFDFKTIAIRKDLRGTFKGGLLAVTMLNEMMETARSKGIRYIDLVLLTLEGTIKSMAERVGFKDTPYVIDRSRILMRKEI
jgi:hypothetical protein